MSRHCERWVISVTFLSFLIIKYVSVVVYYTSVSFTRKVNTRDVEGIRKIFKKEYSVIKWWLVCRRPLSCVWVDTSTRMKSNLTFTFGRVAC
jgi:hypothetical protein